MPPKRSSMKPLLLSADDNGAPAKIMIHPIMIYSAVDSHLGEENQTSLKMIPRIAIILTMVNIVHPVFPSKLMRQNGVYDPAINR